MRDLSQALVLMGCCSLLVACTVPMSDEPGDEEASIDSVQQALVEPQVERRVALASPGGGGFSEGDLSCPVSRPYALSGGTGFYSASSLDINKLYFDSNDGEPVGVHVQTTTSSNYDFYIIGMCSNYAPYKLQDTDSDSDLTVSCPTNYVAVGGGGVCNNSGARLIRSRPSPDTAGSEPTGWRATCSSGSVHTTVNCAQKNSSYWDWSGCKVRKDTFANEDFAFAHCNSGETVVASGAYCGNGGYIRASGVFASSEEADAHCSEDNVTAYAVCCPDVNDIE